MNEITIVTAFFNIGRENFKAIPRTDNKYINDFKFWARIRNKLIVYTDKKNASIISDIRKEYGLEEQTIINIIEDIYSIEPEIYQNIKLISNSSLFIDFRLIPEATSNIPEYSYLMLLKTWFMADAVERNLTTNTVAWVDFGFNHGGDLYTNPDDFKYKWSYSFSEKIHLFYLNNIDEKPIFETVRRLNDCIMGCLIIAPLSLCKVLWQINRESMMILNKIGLSDDDQLIQLMSYRARPELFELHKSEWFLPLKEYGGDHLNIRIKGHYNKRYEAFRIIYVNYIKWKNKQIRIIKYLIRTFMNLEKAE